MKKLVLGVVLVIMTMCLVACEKKGVETGVKVETGDIDVNVTVDTGDVDVNTGDVKVDDTEDTKYKVTLDKYIGGTGKDINNAGYKYVGYNYRDGKYIVKYVTYDVELEIKEKLMELQGSNIAKILIKNENVGLGYELVANTYKFKLTAGSVYMNFELADSMYVFEKYRYEDVKKIRDMGELHSIPISKLQIDHVYCFAEFDEAGNTIINTDNFTEDRAQEMLAACTVVDFYYEYSLK